MKTMNGVDERPMKIHFIFENFDVFSFFFSPISLFDKRKVLVRLKFHDLRGGAKYFLQF